ncbi:efflux RND transporter periplasmic adaptor subunit [uncultured Thiocystis sp.]|jgi:multidrug efflux system membrane fusion protein|uniref:efflux RND transporter periplasmic adaptor subunit n=1 Tax=uncultured Thiocystis sp. TaxID=1202134 RepID=UPI0025FAB66A|nr:efflux RND transporter periplasmic adaptor subunit [uncultured Thiocystis sp.]
MTARCGKNPAGGRWLGLARALLVGLGALLAVGCDPPPPAAVLAPHPVVTVQPRVARVPVYIDEIGRCLPTNRVMIQPQVSGLLLSSHVRDGADVHRGDLLFELDAKTYQVALDRANSKLAEIEAKAEFAKAQLARNTKLRERDVLATRDLDDARKSELEAEAEVLTARADIEAAQIDLKYCAIRSPIDGRAGHRLVDPGNIVSANATELIEIQCFDPIFVELALPEEQLPEVREHIATGELSLIAAYPDAPSVAREGKLVFLDSAVNARTGTVLLRGLFENKDRVFWPGQFVTVRILLDWLDDALLLPKEAVQTGVDGPYLFVVNTDDTVSQRPIRIGQRHGDDILVTEGLKPDETVVLVGQIGLREGARVRVQPAGTSR